MRVQHIWGSRGRSPFVARSAKSNINTKSGTLRLQCPCLYIWQPRTKPALRLGGTSTCILSAILHRNSLLGVISIQSDCVSAPPTLCGIALRIFDFALRGSATRGQAPSPPVDSQLTQLHAISLKMGLEVHWENGSDSLCFAAWESKWSRALSGRRRLT